MLCQSQKMHFKGVIVLLIPLTIREVLGKMKISKAFPVMIEVWNSPLLGSLKVSVEFFSYFYQCPMVKINKIAGIDFCQKALFIWKDMSKLFVVIKRTFGFARFDQKSDLIICQTDENNNIFDLLRSYKGFLKYQFTIRW